MLLKFKMAAVSLLFATSMFAGTDSANAIPAFARKHNVQCSVCHTAWPQLSAAGRQFKELGYRFSETESDELKAGDFPVSGVLVVRPYDKKDSGSTQIRSMHEAELMVAGHLGHNVSGFFEIEAEDETGFAPGVPLAAATYHVNKAVNLQFVWGDILFSDPYGLLADGQRLTRGHVGVLDQTFGGADAGGKLRSGRQSVGISGRPVDQLFYNISYSGDAGDPEGVEARNIYGRLAYDITPDVMVGVLGITGEDDSANRDFTRYGIDFQADFSGARVQGSWITATDDVASGGATEADNDAFSLQAFYVVSGADGGPKWVPLVRFDSYEKNDGVDDYTELTLNVTHYLSQNVKVYAEYWQQLDVPTGSDEDNRFTIQGAVAF